MEIVYNGEKDSRLFKAVIGETVDRLIAEDEKMVWLDADTMSCSGTRPCAKNSDRYINCGIAEANMMGVAAGLSAAGMKPFAHSFAPFATRRCFDQIFLSGAYGGNGFTVVGTDPGITAEVNGGTHMPFEDTGIFRTVPGAVITDITDVPMLINTLEKFKDTPGMKYIRVSRKISRQVYADGSNFEIGRGIVVRDGEDAVIVACGMMVHEALQAALMLENDGISTAVIDPYTIKPLDTELIRSYASRTGCVVAAENHNKYGGLVSAVTEAVVGMELKFGYVAVEDAFGEVGALDYLKERFGLSAAHIAAKVRQCLNK